MKNKEPKDKAPESAVANTVQESELANRRSFMKNLAAGTVAAGALAGTVERGLDEGRDHQRAGIGPTARRPTALLRICFPKQRPRNWKRFSGPSNRR